MMRKALLLLLVATLVSAQTYRTVTYTRFTSSGAICDPVSSVSAQASVTDSDQCIPGSQLLGPSSTGSVRFNFFGTDPVLVRVTTFASADCSGPIASDRSSVANTDCYSGPGGLDVRVSFFTQDRALVSVFSGVYSISTGCNPASCCCLQGTFAASQFGSQVTAVLGLRGQCSTSTSAPTTWQVSSSNQEQATFSFLGQSYTVTKTGATLAIVNTNTNGCSTASAACSSGDCRNVRSNICFHEATQIEYKGMKASLADFLAKKMPECVVPHIVHAAGVRITVACKSKVIKTLRLTDEHLVFFGRSVGPMSAVPVGVKAAAELGPADVVFSDVAEHDFCHVLRVERDAPGKYFGLNCKESVVLADGIKTSTFGRFHTVPSLYMKYASSIFGIEIASKIGDAMSEAFHKFF